MMIANCDVRKIPGDLFDHREWMCPFCHTLVEGTSVHPLCGARIKKHGKMACAYRRQNKNGLWGGVADTETQAIMLQAMREKLLD